jgi:hypothetical protein
VRRGGATLALAFVASLRGDGVAGAAADGGVASPPELTVVVVRSGHFTRTRLFGGRLLTRDAAGQTLSQRELDGGERRRLFEAAQRALEDPHPQTSCPDQETFVSVTIDPRTASSTFCPTRNLPTAEPARWRALVALLRDLLEPRR